MRYTVTFLEGRIGRHLGVAPLELEVSEALSLPAADISEQVYYHARQFLASRDVDVTTNLGEDAHLGGTGTVFAGFHVAATFTVAPVSVPAS